MTLYPYKKGRLWAVFTGGQDHEFKTLSEAEAFCRLLNCQKK